MGLLRHMSSACSGHAATACCAVFSRFCCRQCTSLTPSNHSILRDAVAQAAHLISMLKGFISCRTEAQNRTGDCLTTSGCVENLHISLSYLFPNITFFVTLSSTIGLQYKVHFIKHGLHTCRRASELRSSLNYAAEAKAALQKATDSLQKRGQPEHAAALQGAIQVGEAAGDVLGTDVAHAKVVVARWHAGVATEAKLNSALRDCTSAQALGRAIQVRCFWLVGSCVLGIAISGRLPYSHRAF